MDSPKRVRLRWSFAVPEFSPRPTAEQWVPQLTAFFRALLCCRALRVISITGAKVPFDLLIFDGDFF